MGCSASKEEVPIKTTEPLKNEPASEPQFIKTNVLNKEEDAKVVEILNHLPSPTKHTLEPLSSLSSQTSSIQGSKLAPIVRKGDNLEKSVLPEIGKKSIGKSLPSLGTTHE